MTIVIELSLVNSKSIQNVVFASNESSAVSSLGVKERRNSLLLKVKCKSKYPVERA